MFGTSGLKTVTTSHLIADANEGWVVWQMSGGKKLWAAERLGENDVRVLYPGYIEDFPVDFQNSSDYMGSPNIVSFAIEQGWWNPNGTEPFGTAMLGAWRRLCSMSERSGS